MDETKLIICRCEEVSRAEILQAIQDGHHSVDSIKKAVRAGMGACQGRTCGRMIMGILLEQGAVAASDITGGKARFPVVPCPVDNLGEGDT